MRVRRAGPAGLLGGEENDCSTRDGVSVTEVTLTWGRHAGAQAPTENDEAPSRVSGTGLHHIKSGNDLLSRTVTRAVPSALRGLTAEFGMGSGVTPSLWSPEFHILTVG